MSPCGRRSRRAVEIWETGRRECASQRMLARSWRSREASALAVVNGVFHGWSSAGTQAGRDTGRAAVLICGVREGRC